MSALTAWLGSLIHVVHTAGVSPAQASPAAITAVDLGGATHILEEFGRVIAFADRAS